MRKWSARERRGEAWGRILGAKGVDARGEKRRNISERNLCLSILVEREVIIPK